MIPDVSPKKIIDADYYKAPSEVKNPSRSGGLYVDIDPITEEEDAIRKEIENDPKLKKLFGEIMENFSEEPPVVQFNMNRVVFILIALCQALQEAASVFADKLTKVTERLTAYSKKLTQVPVVLQSEGTTFSGIGDNQDQKYKNEADARALVNQKFGNMLEAIRANKGLDEDKAKKIQTILQTMKDASASSSDFITAFIDLVRGLIFKDIPLRACFQIGNYLNSSAFCARYSGLSSITLNQYG